MWHEARAIRVILGLVLVGFLACEGVRAALPACAPRRPSADGAALPASTASFRLAPYRAPTSSPAATPAAPAAPEVGPAVWLGGDGSLTMLSAAGWQTFSLPGIVRDIAVDAQGRAILAPGLHMCDGRVLRDLLPPAPGGEQDAVAIDGQGRIWVGYYGGIAVLEGGRWRPIPLAQPSASSQGQQVRDLAFDAQGGLWVATGAGLAHYDGNAWQRDTGPGRPGAEAVDCITVDRQGRIWAAHAKGVSVFDGSSWLLYPLDVVAFVRGLAADPAGNMLAGSYYHGVSLFDGDVWFTYADLNCGLPSDRVTSLAVDPLGRIWVGTHSGLAVHDEEHWLTYQEANSGLADNQVTALAIGGSALGRLPPLQPERGGRLAGQVTLRQRPVAGARVVICSELSLAQGFDDNPCDNASFGRESRTGADGRYAFDGVPAGHYAIAAEVEPGRWVARTRVLSAVRYQVRGGATTEAETIEGTE